MDLDFVKVGSKYIAEFEATSDFNLHIERDKGGALYVQHKTIPDGEYDSIAGADFSKNDLVIDCDFTAAVYPKYIKVVSTIMPKVSQVTFA